MTLVLGALDGEIAAAVSGLDELTVSEWNGFRIHHGRIGGVEVVVARTGVGKSMSALFCQYLVGACSPDRILFTGVAGALNPEFRIGDTLVARDCMMHDMDVTSLGFKRGEIPYSPYRVFTCDPGLVALAASVQPIEGRAFVGRVLTGDQFVASADVRNDLRQELGGDAVEMEGASVGLVAAVNRIPFLLVRTISDKADGGPRVDFKAFLAFASRNSWHYLKSIVLGK